MKKNIWTILIFLSIISLFALFSDACRGAKNPVEETKLWSPIEPFQSGYLEVSDIHKIYYELSGNSEGKPVFFLHGGPGGSSSPYMRRFCDPDKFLMVLSDQRGAGKSKPFGEIKENTTQNLVEDIERLRKHLKLEKIILFGGSWGTTLGIAYAEAYPGNVSGMVLRGVFMATKEEINHFYHGGVGRYFPEIYETLLSTLPEPSRQPLPDYLFQLIKEGSQEDKAKFSRAWAQYEGKISGLEVPDEVIKKAD
jgi:proline iminopeptidase